MGEDKEFMSHLAHDDWFGGKTIGFFAGVALLVNNITGPGVPALANMFAESGWLVPTLMFIFVWLMSTISTTMFCEAMRHIPGNSHFRDRIEYTTIVKYYFGKKAYIASQIGLNGALQSLNIISVIQSAQVMDNAIAAIFGKSCALNLSPFPNHDIDHNTLEESTKFWTCMDTNNIATGENAWGCHMVLSMGYIVALVLTVPMGYFNLDDNMKVQVGAFIITFLCWFTWFVACFFAEPFSDGTYGIPVITDNSLSYASQAGVLGTILFNFGFVTTVPSWVNEKKPNVSVNKVVWLSTFVCIIVFFMMGIPGAMGFAKYLQGPGTGLCEFDQDTGDNCAQSLMDIFTGHFSPADIRSSKAGNFIVQFSVFIFPVAAVLSSIPVFSIVIKYNCLENGLSHKFSFIWGVLFPWIIALPLLYQPNALNQFINFSSLLFVSFTDFIVPCLLYIVLQRKAAAARNEKTPLLENGAPNSVNESEKEAIPLLEDLHEHFSFPPSWGMSLRTKVIIAIALVVSMTAASIAGTVLTITTSVTTSWQCS